MAAAVVVESPLPAPALPPPPPTISFQDQEKHLEASQERGKQVLTSIAWLLDRMQEQQASFAKLEFDFNSFRKEADAKIWEAQQKEELLEHRFEIMEGALKKKEMMQSQMNLSFGAAMQMPRDFSVGVPPAQESRELVVDSAEPSKTDTPADVLAAAVLEDGSANLAQSMTGQSMGLGQSFGADSALLAQSVTQLTDLEAEVRALTFNMKKMDNHIKHQEQQQIQRDQAQDEIQRMEFAKINRDIEVRITEKELESFRSIMLGKLGHLEAEAKEDAERAGKTLKENLGEKIQEVQASLERISESVDKQVRLIDEKISANDAHDDEREEVNKKTMADLRNNIGAMGRQMSLLADHVGIDPEVMSQTAGMPLSSEAVGDPAAGGGGAVGATNFNASGKSNFSQGGGGGAMGSRMDALERRVDSLDGGGGGGAALPEGSDGPVSGVGSRPSSRGQPLPARVERLEDNHEELIQTLEDTLGIPLMLGSGSEDETGDPLSPGLAKRKADIGPDRLSLLEAQVSHLAAAMGVEVPTAPVPGVGGPSSGRDPVPPGSAGSVGGGGAGGTAARLGLLDAKMDEVASALGLTPAELESFARADSRGNLAGRVVLRDEGNAVSPRMAGMIAGQEDRIGQLDTLMNELIRDCQQKFLDQMDVHDLRLRNLEDHSGIKPPSRAKGDNLNALESRMNRAANEDIGSLAEVAKAKAKAKAAAGLVASGAFEGGTGAAGTGSRENEEVLNNVMDEVKRLGDDTDEIKDRLGHLDSALEMLRAGTPAPVVQAALAQSPRPDSGSGAARVASEAAKNSEKAALAAAMSAEECQTLKEELAEIVNAVNVPSMGSMDDSLFGDAKPVDGEDLDIDDEVRDDAARQYVERQSVMEARLKQLEEHIDSASVVMPESQIFTSLKAVIKDVRRCLSRCELLYQLPEIKMFVKRFQRSLEVNAILHERWVGPGAGQRPGSQQDNRTSDRPGSSQQSITEEMVRDSDMTRSAPDLRLKNKGGGRGKEGVKKKPFRTVVDWVRPHTPLKIDPMFKGHTPNPSQPDKSAKPPSSAPHLPQIK